ncbi:MAG: hypothetical protein WCF67_00350, partial [Chitinophagaceae bacterium]
MKLEDRLKSLLAALALAVSSGVTTLIGIDNAGDFWKSHLWLRYLLAGLLTVIFLLLVFLDTLLKLYRKRVMRRRNLSDVVISKRVITLSILDRGGHKANYFQKAQFSNIKDGAYIAIVTSDPNNVTSYINPIKIQLANCSAQFDNCNKYLRLFFVDEIASLNKSASLYPVEKYFYFNVELIDSFLQIEADSWDITTFNYTKVYELNIHFPPGRRINNNVYLFRKQDGEEEKVDAAKPVIVNKGDRDSI